MANITDFKHSELPKIISAMRNEIASLKKEVADLKSTPQQYVAYNKANYERFKRSVEICNPKYDPE